MITILLLIVGVIFLIAGGVLLVNIAHAPEGYEDASGFHFGKEPDLLSKRPTTPKLRKVRGPIHGTSRHLPAT